MKDPVHLSHLFVARDTVSHGEKLISALGCFAAILMVAWSSHYFVGGTTLLLMVASMGASAVLLFAVPHSPFSLPWSVFGGQTVSAVVGISCLYLIADPVWGLAVAVGSATLAMQYLRCLHPPGGATAAAAVLGGEPILELGYHFALTPVGLNAAVILAMAVILNNLLPRRHYPAALKQVLQPKKPEPIATEPEAISEEDIASALRRMNTVIDVDQNDLAEIYALALEHAHAPLLEPSAIKLGRFYSNGKYGENWSVRQVVDQPASHGTVKPEDRIAYRVVAGKDRRQRGATTRQEFAEWARYEVYRNETCWHRTEPCPDGSSTAPSLAG